MERNLSAARTHRLKLALITSLAGKGIASIVQLVALPIAINALGQDRFGAYAMLAAILNWMNILSVTIGPGLTVQLVRASAATDEQSEAKTFGTAVILSSVFAAFLLVAAQLVLRQVGIEKLFGSNYLPFGEQLRSAVGVLCAFLCLNLVLSVAEAAQSAYQRQFIHNGFLAAGNIITIMLMFVLVREKPSISNMIIAVYLGPLVGRTCSLMQLLHSRPYLMRGLVAVDRRAVTAMMRTGAAFVLTSVGSFCYQSLSVYWVGRRLGPTAAAHMAVFMTILATIGSVLIMFTQPLWPAIQEARARHDSPWVSRTYARSARYLMTFFGVASLAIALAGNQLIHLWIRSAAPTDTSSQIMLGAYLLLATWEQLNYSFLIGFGYIWFSALCYLAGAVVMLSNGAWLVTTFGISGMLAALCLGPLLVTAWIYPIKLKSLFAEVAGYGHAVH